MPRTHGRIVRRGRAARNRTRGQALVEFALVFPIFIVLICAVIEFAFVFSAMLGISYATRNAALLAAEAGDKPDADCQILRSVEDSVGAPANKNQVTSVVIYRADQNGVAIAGENDTYSRTGSTTCTSASGATVTVPYTVTNSTYPPANRCNVLAGCVDLGRSGLDTIGVQVTYDHLWVTPLRTLGAGSGPGFTLTQSNSMRMEPIL